MTQKQYRQYEARVDAFFVDEGIDILTTDDEEGFFSWSPCDCCKTPLGGTRYVAMGAKAGIGPNSCEYNICEDCLYYASYGRLDDETMAAIA